MDDNPQIDPFLTLHYDEDAGMIYLQPWVTIPAGLRAAWGGVHEWGSQAAFPVSQFLLECGKILAEELSQYPLRDPRSELAMSVPPPEIERLPQVHVEQREDGRLGLIPVYFDEHGPIYADDVTEIPKGMTTLELWQQLLALFAKSEALTNSQATSR